MWLTRFEVNTARRDSRRLLGSPQVMHAAVLAGFPPDSGGEGDGRVLWRLDRGEGARTTLWVVSPDAPDLTHLVEQAGWPTAPQGWDSRPYDPLLDRLAEGQRWAFRLSANPVYRRRQGRDSPSPVLGHITVDQQEQWLAERAAPHGFALVEDDGARQLVVKDRRVLRFPRQGQTVTVSQAVYEGVLEVTDPIALREALVRGLGRAKGYGCGLLTLAPLR